jgi:hypothetical protein
MKLESRPARARGLKLFQRPALAGDSVAPARARGLKHQLAFFCP